ncbi:MAG: hypothetical protein IPJ41_02375 [Phycisphaerales bacterium]|nr:hypothetical protein [Phycisphaerales bacterium]
MEQFLCTYSPPRPTFAEDATPAEQLVVAEHFAYLTAALDAGRLLLAGRTLDQPPMGLAICEAESEAAARSFFAADPAVLGGVFRAEIRPYRVALLRAAEPS